MIKKITRIDNIFSYSFFDWDKINFITFIDNDGGQQTRDGYFVKNNIIFAENTNGKSKLVDILKSLDGQDIKLEKNWDRPADKQEAKIILDDDSDINFTETGWSNQILKSKFVIFDEYFIDSFVHSIGPDCSDTPQRRQQRGRNIIYLGSFAEYNNEIDKVNTLKNSISEKNSYFLETEQAKIAGLLNGQNITVEELVGEKEGIKKLKENDLKDKKGQLTKQQGELKKIEETLKEKSRIVALSLLSEIKISFSLEVEQASGGKVTLDPNKLFSFTVAKGVQQTLHKIAHKKDFVKQGLFLITDETTDCPFCEQKIKNGDYVQIIKDYQDIFDENFAKEEQGVNLLLSKYRNILECLRDLQTPMSNQGNFNAVKPFITIDDELSQPVLAEKEKMAVKTEINLVLEKEKKILEKITGSRIDEIKTIIKKANELIENYDKVVSKINGKIQQLKKDLAEGKLEVKKTGVESGITKLKNEIFYIENKECFEKYFGVMEQYKVNQKIVESLERIYQVLKDKIIEEFNKFVLDYFDLIKGFVREISPSMEILDISGQASYDRRNPRDPAQCGFRIEYNGKDRIGSLSKGEKQAIALSFFFAQLRKENDKEKIIVLDDPITSFDAGKRKSTAELIQRETNAFGQLFILTCDPLFREYCLKQIDNRNFYYIFKTMKSSSIHYVPSNRETIYSSFETEFKNIDNVHGSNENVVVYGQKLRFCLETKIKEDYFGYSEDNLSNMIKKVTGRNKKEFEKLFDNKETILQIYSYCNTGGLAHYPKDGSTSWNELKDKIKQYLGLNL